MMSGLALTQKDEDFELHAEHYFGSVEKISKILGLPPYDIPSPTSQPQSPSHSGRTFSSSFKKRHSFSFMSFYGALHKPKVAYPSQDAVRVSSIIDSLSNHPDASRKGRHSVSSSLSSSCPNGWSEGVRLATPKEKESSVGRSSSETSTLHVVSRDRVESLSSLAAATTPLLEQHPPMEGPRRLSQSDERRVLRPRPKPVSRSSASSPQSSRSKSSRYSSPTDFGTANRCGVEYRPNSPRTSPSFFSILNKQKLQRPSESNGKNRDEPKNLDFHPLSPAQSSQIPNSSLDSNTHILGEAGRYTDPFFDAYERKNRIPPTPVLTSSIRSEDSSFNYETPRDDDDDDFESTLVEEKWLKRSLRREKTLSKLARTLGEDAVKALQDISSDPIPISRKNRKLMAQRRGSLGSISLLSQPPASSSSQYTLSTLADDLHKLGIEEDFESWSEVDRSRSHSPESPILFSPPLPPKSSVPSVADTQRAPMAEETSPVSDCQLSADFAIPQSRVSSLPPFPPKDAQRAPMAGETPPVSDFQNFAIPQVRVSKRRNSYMSVHLHSPSILDDLSNDWKIPPFHNDEELAFTVTRNIAEKPVAWTGEWNYEMEDVIKALRALKKN